MSNYAEIVAEIFRETGSAFTALSEITLMLVPAEPTQPSVELTPVEIEMLQECVGRFVTDINQMSHRIKNRTIARIKADFKRKAFAEAGIPLPDENNPTTPSDTPEPEPLTPPHVSTQQPANITLNMLNATEDENDMKMWQLD